MGMGLTVYYSQKRLYHFPRIVFSFIVVVFVDVPSQKMSIAGWFSCEPSVTHFALIRFFPSVRSHVQCNSCRIDKASLAHMTLEVQGFIVRHLNVAIQSVPGRVFFSADFAIKRFTVFCVYEFVAFKTVSFRENLLANRALVFFLWFLYSVNLSVFVKVCRIGVGFTTSLAHVYIPVTPVHAYGMRSVANGALKLETAQLALIGFLACVPEDVGISAVEGSKLLLADITAVRSLASVCVAQVTAQ